MAHYRHIRQLIGVNPQATDASSMDPPVAAPEAFEEAGFVYGPCSPQPAQLPTSARSAKSVATHP
jgi:hypothetical protein